MRLIPLLFKHRRYIAPLCLLGSALTLGVVSGGCGGSYSSTICDNRCDCVKCGTNERNSCYSTLDANLLVAQKIGCQDATDAYYFCRSGGTCSGGDYSEKGCDRERNNYFSCLLSEKCGDDLVSDGVGSIRCL